MYQAQLSRMLSLNDSLSPARASRGRGAGSAKNLETTQTIILSLT
jgi:hypothetical protein